MNRRLTLMRAMMRVRRAWTDHVKEISLAEGIPDSYRHILMFLFWNPGSKQRNIAEFAGVTTSAINQVVKNMLEEDYLRKEIDETDKRNTRLYLTEKGNTVAQKLHEKLNASDDAITAEIGAEKEAEMIAFLEYMADYIRKELR